MKKIITKSSRITTLNIVVSVTYGLELHIVIHVYYLCNFTPSKDVNVL